MPPNKSNFSDFSEILENYLPNRIEEKQRQECGKGKQLSLAFASDFPFL
jgi:hypothetical protein